MISSEFIRTILDRLRIFAILSVVIGHATRMFTSVGVYAHNISFPPPYYSSFEFITDLIYSFHMPLFFILSGYVYQICVSRGSDYSYLFPFLKKKFLRLIVPYLTWGVLYVAPVMILLQLAHSSYFDYVKVGIIMGLDSRHLWFLLALFNIFSFIQMLRLSVKK